VPRPESVARESSAADARTDVKAHLSARDPAFIRQWWPVVRLAQRIWHRPEVRNIERLPAGACLVVSNHSGGALSMDAPILFEAFAAHNGMDRPAYLLAHDVLFKTPLGALMKRWGIVPANPGVASAALKEGGVVLVFPGGDEDVYRPTTNATVIDFHGRTGYLTLAAEAGVPIVPVVSIGGQETQLFLSSGTKLAKALQLPKFLRARVMPVTLGMPFGVAPLNLPLPSKIVVQVLDPVEPPAADADPQERAAVDKHIRAVMQRAMNQLARERRLPVLG
jgi:1-acyl-sn-glycerol-3-phosphate acyltransferase